MISRTIILEKTTWHRKKVEATKTSRNHLEDSSNVEVYFFNVGLRRDKDIRILFLHKSDLLRIITAGVIKCVNRQ